MLILKLIDKIYLYRLSWMNINVYSVLPFGIPKIGSIDFLCQMYNDPIHRQIINRMNKNKEFSWKKDYFSSFQELLKVKI